MRTLIIFATKHGTTADCANQLKSKINGEIVTCQLGKERAPSLDGFDQVLVGGSIHIGKIQKQVVNFVTKEKDTLLKKRLGLFICCMAEGDTAEAQLKAAFPAELVEHAFVTGTFGGCYKFSNMGWLSRKMIKMVEKSQTGHEISTDQDIDKTNPEAIETFAAAVNG